MTGIFEELKWEIIQLRKGGRIMEFIFVLNVVYVGCKVVAQGGL